MSLQVIALVALAMLVLGVAAVFLRRSIIGVLVGVQLGAGGLMLLATALFDLAGTEPSTGQLFVAALVAFGAAAAVLVAALHLAAARAARKTSDLEPW